MKYIAWGVGIIVVGGIAWYLASPLFINKTVIEPAPMPQQKTTNLEEQISGSELEGHLAMMEEAGEDVVMQETLEAMMGARAVDEPQAEPEAEQYPRTRAQGVFQSVGHEGTGIAMVIQTDENNHILRFENLDVLNGPDLRVVLSPSATITKADDLGDYLELGKLKGNKGDQNYAIPADVDISTYKSAIIYCKAFRVVFNTAELR